MGTGATKPEGRYQPIVSLGRGGMANVHLAVARGPMGFRKLSVLKYLRPELASDPTFLAMFLDEARLAARLNHPNVVHTYEVGEHETGYFIAMEYLEGQALDRVAAAVLQAGSPLEPWLAARILADALAGLHYAHELRDYDGHPMGVVHRDVSPQNVFVTYEGRAKVVDFGIAKAAQSSTHTEVGMLKGKIAYMAPEQATHGPLDRRSDVFAAGIVLWELVSGKRLFASGAISATLRKVISEPIPSLNDVMKDVAPALVDCVTKALARDPEERFQTALEFRLALEAYIAACGKPAAQEDVGARVSALFADARTKTQEQIQTFLSAPALDALAHGSGGGDHDASGSGSSFRDGTPPAYAVAPVRARRGRTVAALLVMVVAAATLALASTATLRSHAAAGPADHFEEPRRAAAAVASSTVAQAPIAQAPPPSPPPEMKSAPPPPRPARPTASPRSRADSRAMPSPKDVEGPKSDAARAEEALGYLTLETYPWTTVTEGTRVLGVTPLVRVPMAAGTHILTLENPDEGIKHSYSVVVETGETLSRRLALQ